MRCSIRNWVGVKLAPATLGGPLVGPDRLVTFGFAAGSSDIRAAPLGSAGGCTSNKSVPRPTGRRMPILMAASAPPIRRKSLQRPNDKGASDAKADHDRQASIQHADHALGFFPHPAIGTILDRRDQFRLQRKPVCLRQWIAGGND